MPLLLAEINKQYTIKHISATQKILHHLKDLGFTPGTQLCLLESITVILRTDASFLHNEF